MSIGVLALQGDVREHTAAFAQLGVPTRLVRRPQDLDPSMRGVVLPGGESTTLSLLLESSGLYEPLAQRLAEGLPVLGTCAGLVLLASQVLDGRDDQRSFGVLDCVVRRNGYGRQRFSFEAELAAPGITRLLGGGEETMPGVFIRAPLVTSVGPGVEVLATLPAQAPGPGAGPGTGAKEVTADGGRPHPVVVRQGPVLGVAFHPELTADRRVHQLFAKLVAER